MAVSGQRRGNGLPSALGRLLVTMLQNRSALLALNVLAVIYLTSTSNLEFNNYDLGVSLLNAGIDCPDPPPLTGVHRASTTSIVQPNDPELHKTATVMAMATGYGLGNYQVFVGSLRKTGYEGNIILVVAPDIGKEEESYLRKKNVIIHKAQYVNCNFPLNEEMNKVDKTKMAKHDTEMATCVHPYPKIKHRWGRFPLLRDLLKECGGQPNPEIKCGGPVLVTDMRDTFFQRNPFGPEAPRVYGLQVFEEHATIRTTHWLVDWPVNDCKGVRYNEPMLCSGTTIGTRQAMLDYLEIMHEEMTVWMNSPKCCCFRTNGDDQSIHNYLYYAGMLNGVTGGVQAVKNRDGIVNTVGAMGSLIHDTHVENRNILRKATNHEDPNGGAADKYDISKEEDKTKTKNWLGLHYGMTDEKGYFTQFDGSRSFVIHQFDRFGNVYHDWLHKNKEKIYLP